MPSVSESGRNPEDFPGGVSNKQFGRYQALLAGEPAEDNARKQADGGHAVALVGIVDAAVWHGDCLRSPEKPLLNLAVKSAVEQLDVEDFFPCGGGCRSW